MRRSLYGLAGAGVLALGVSVPAVWTGQTPVANRETAAIYEVAAPKGEAAAWSGWQATGDADPALVLPFGPAGGEH